MATETVVLYRSYQCTQRNRIERAANEDRKPIQDREDPEETEATNTGGQQNWRADAEL